MSAIPMKPVKARVKKRKRGAPKKRKPKKKKPKKKTCPELKVLFDQDSAQTDMNNPEYDALLRCISEENRAKYEQPDTEVRAYLYPHLDDPDFNEKIASKKEFYDTRYEEKTPEDFDNIKEVAQQLCDNTEFELEPHQMFVRNFMSFQTPYNGLLLFHGLGTGKTCSAISVCEEMRTYLKQLGIMKRIIIVASPTVQENFKLQLFDERKLKSVGGLWNIKACTGNKFLKEVNPMTMRGLPRNRIVNQIKRIIRQSYHFQGYIEFSNYIGRIIQRATSRGDTAAKRGRKISRALKREFSDRMLVVDEVHNLRVSERGTIKQSSENIITLVKNADNLKLLILSATPMFNSYTEVVWLLNLLNLNDKRFPVSEREIFDSKGNFQVDKGGRATGEALLIQKITGYISYVRGENPFTFPYSIYPNTAGNPASLTGLLADGTWTYPTEQLNGGAIVAPIHLLDLAIVRIGVYQELGYQLLLQQLGERYPILNDPNKGLSYTILEAPLQALNMIYPHKDLGPDTEEISEELATTLYGHSGLSRLMTYDRKTKSGFKYKDATLRDFGAIFGSEEIGKYSGKIGYICGKIRESTGIVFIYSQYIDGGAVPLALALEEMGITRYGNRNLFAEPRTTPLDALTMQPIVAGERGSFPAKYIMITGDKTLTPDVRLELKAVTGEDNTYGERVKVVIVSRAGSEGLDFKNIRQTHILDPWYNLNRQNQIVGRAIRNFSHCALPYEERNVEIYMYGTMLVQGQKEAADLYVYRLAERKAIKIAAVTRILKENAVDCLLNRAALDFSEEKINKSVQQTLSSGAVIEYRLGDRPNSSICDFTACEYTCNTQSQEIDEADITTYNETFIIMNLDKILQRIRLLYKEQYIYKKIDLIRALVQIKNYPLDQIYTALNYLVNEKNEYITDMLDRLGHLVNIGDYYLFQPVELENKHITHYERTHPIPFKRDKLIFNLPVNVPRPDFLRGEGMEDLESRPEQMKILMAYLAESYQQLQEPSYITSKQKANWPMAASWAIQNLVTYNQFDRDILIRLGLYHILDTLDYNKQLILLRNIYFKDSLTALETHIKSYFDQFIIQSKGETGIVLSNFSKPATQSPYSLLVMVVGKWEHRKESAEGGFLQALFEKFQIRDLDQVSNMIGFMTIFRQHEIVFKTKGLALSAKKRTNKGHRCDRGEVRKKIVERINTLLADGVQPIKYRIQKSTITSIYGSKDIKQKTKDGKAKDVKHNSLQLCAENELILRWFNIKKKDGRRWFFTSLEATINNIPAMGR